MNEQEYKICKKRGHESNGIVLTSIPPQYVCKYCGVNFKYSEPKIVELS